ncbi:MAG: hypothetical protein WBE26_20195, partial [Phycisphaerae bacterium]
MPRILSRHLPEDREGILGPVVLGPAVKLRAVPYPYRAMLAICSDLDETPDRAVYWEIMRFLNTTQTTSIGPGVGLEVGNTIYFDMPPEQFAYWNTDDTGREMVRALIRSGHIDCLHSYGDLATTRSHAGRALEELARHDCQLEVWIDHAVAPSNFGADIMKGLGDLPGSEAYHADLTCDYGIKYVWRGRVTSVIGQEVRRSLRGIANPRHAAGSIQTVAKEALKGALGRCGYSKYALHGPNKVLRRTSLRDGRPLYEFIRSNPYWGGVDRAATADGLAEALTPAMLQRLLARRGVCILYTHLGKIHRREKPFTRPTLEALRHLSALYHDGKVLVTTTRRLLGFRRAACELAVSARRSGRGLQIDLQTSGDGGVGPLTPGDLDGLTFYASDPDQTRVTIDDREVEHLQRNPPDETGQPSVSLPR